MHIESICHEGNRSFTTPSRLKPRSVRVLLDVPDEAVGPEGDHCPGVLRKDLPLQVVACGAAMGHAADALRSAPPPSDDELSELSDQQRQGLQALALREEP